MSYDPDDTQPVEMGPAVGGRFPDLPPAGPPPMGMDLTAWRAIHRKQRDRAGQGIYRLPSPLQFTDMFNGKGER